MAAFWRKFSKFFFCHEFFFIQVNTNRGTKERMKKFDHLFPGNWDIDILTWNCCKSLSFWTKTFWHHSNDRSFEALENAHGFCIVLPPNKEPRVIISQCGFLFWHGYIIFQGMSKQQENKTLYQFQCKKFYPNRYHAQIVSLVHFFFPKGKSSIKAHSS